ncbi:MAG: hypothetical protein EBV19_11360, partial [Flavobacteriia bacterium]|nr:hypothetical protein [Flavobacteriia bacterium]
MQDFERLWGQRSNSDFWRLSNRKSEESDNFSGGSSDPNNKKTDAEGKTTDKIGGSSDKNPNATNKSAGIDSSAIPKNIPAEEKRFYTPLPFSATAQKEALAKIEKSLFNAAQIYQTRLSEPATAIDLYNQLIQRFPNSEYAPQAHYEIVKLNRSTGDYAMADKFKSQLIDKFPKSIYVRMLESNASAEIVSSGVGSKSIDSMLTVISDYFVQEKYNDVFAAKQFVDKQFAGNEYQAQFDYIYASAFIRSGNSKKGIELMQQVAADYPTNPIGNRARDICDAFARLESEKANKSTEGESNAANTGGSGTGSTEVITAGASGATSSTLYKNWDGKSEKFVI